MLTTFTNLVHASSGRLVFISILVLSSISPLFSQNETPVDSLSWPLREQTVEPVNVKEHSPHKATIYSMLLPGLGQAYNKKYWKIPIVYAGFGVFYYLIKFNNDEYQKWSEAYYFVLANPGEDLPGNDYVEKYGDDPDYLKANKDYYRRNRDLNYILSALWYLLNVVDATVDAHLYSWEVNEDLSMRIEPEMFNGFTGYKPVGGLKLSLRF